MAVKVLPSYQTGVVSHSLPVGLGDLPKSAQETWKVLALNGPMKPCEIANRTDLSGRTVRYALSRLVSAKLVKKVPDLQDLRSHFYRIAN